MDMRRFLLFIVLTVAIMAAPFIAFLFRTEAGLVVMAVALSAGTFLLADALGGAHRSEDRHGAPSVPPVRLRMMS